MTRRGCSLLVCALVAIASVTGCGGGGTSNSKSTPATPTHASSTTTTSTSSLPLSVRLNKAVAACRKGVAKSPYISAAEKAAGETDCDGVKTGSVAAISRLRAILKKACEQEVVAKIPAADQPTALKECAKVY